MYAVLRRPADDLSSALAPRRARHPLASAFRTLDATSYTEIATVPVDRIVLDLAVSANLRSLLRFPASDLVFQTDGDCRGLDNFKPTFFFFFRGVGSNMTVTLQLGPLGQGETRGDHLS